MSQLRFMRVSLSAVVCGGRVFNVSTEAIVDSFGVQMCLENVKKRQVWSLKFRKERLSVTFVIYDEDLAS